MMHDIKVYNADELSQKEFPEEEWLLKPFLTRGGDWLVAGEEDACKSLFLLQLCIHASLGYDFHMVEVEKPRKIIYIGADDSAREVQKRLFALNTTGTPLNDNLKLICQPSIDFNIRGCEQIMRWVDDYDPDILIFDHLTAYVIGGTNDPNGMHDYGVLKRDIKSRDKGVIAVTHFNRTTEGSKNDPLIRRVGGNKSILADHGVITLHDKISEASIGHGKQVGLEAYRTKNDGGKKGQYDTSFEISVNTQTGKTLFKEM